MPTYQYECAKCGQSFEIFQSMKDSALDICPKDKCAQKRWGRGKVRRQLGTGAGLIFKGSGFYITDYRSESYKAAARKESDGGSGATKGGGSDAKPAATPAPTGKSAAPASSPAPAARSATT